MIRETATLGTVYRIVVAFRGALGVVAVISAFEKKKRLEKK